MNRFLAIVILTLSAVQAWAGDLPVTLRAAASIQGDVVKLGDLWDNLGPKADVILAGAPQPGKRIVADARWLAAVAQANDIAWQPASSFDRIVIERAGQMVDMRLVETELRDALSMEGVAGPFEVEVANRSALNFMVPTNQAAVVAVRDVSWDSRTNRFSATVEVAGGSSSAVTQRLSGRVFPVARVPVLARAMNRGDIISERDIEWLELRTDLARRDIIVNADDIIGQEPRYPLRAGAPLRASELRRPVLVERNALVTVALRTPYMSLTTQAKALDAGGKGDIIRISNLKSKRTVEGVIEGPGLVSVSPNGPPQLSN